MAFIKIHAGDFLPGQFSQFSWGEFTLKTEKHRILGERIPLSKLVSVEVASENNVKNTDEAMGVGLAGALVLGPIGLLAGVLAGKTSKEVTFVAKFDDGRKMLATTDAKTFTKLQAATF